MSTDLEKAVNKVKFSLIKNRKLAFISNVFFSLKLKWNENIPTARVSGLEMEINPKFFLSLPDNVKLFVFVHETWHVVLKHILRASRIPKVHFEAFNYAADYVINLQASDDGLEIWEHALFDRKYAGWSTEQVYQDLVKNPPPEGYNQDYIDIDPTPSKTPKEKAEAAKISSEIDRIILKADKHRELSKAPGKLPGEIQIHIDKLKRPIIPWVRVIEDYMDAFDKIETSWARPNRRYMPQLYMPSKHSPSMEHLATAWDLSGSVEDEDIAFMATEVKSLRQKFTPELTTVLTFDHVVKKVNKLTPNDAIEKIKLFGKGGTNFDPVIEYFNKHIPNVLIIFTDMAADPITVKPKFPIVWIAINAMDYYKNKQPYGKVINYTGRI